MLSQKKRNLLVFFAKSVVSVGLISYLIWVVDWQQVIQIVKQTNIYLVLVGSLCTLSGLMAASFRWRIILTDNKVHFAPLQAFRGYLIGIFYSIFLPGVIGGDIVRIGICAKQTGCQIGVSAACVFIERFCGMFVVFCFLLLSILLFQNPWDFSAISLRVILGIVLLFLFVLFLMGKFAKIIPSPQENANQIWKSIFVGIQVIQKLRIKSILIVFILSVTFQAADIITIYIFSQALGIRASLGMLFTVIPLVYMATILPISLGGLGVREGTMVFLLSQYGIATTDGVILSLLVYLHRVMFGILGGLTQLIPDTQNNIHNQLDG